MAIVADPTIAAVVGTICSVAALTAAPILSNAGYSLVSPDNRHPSLTAPGTHAAGYLRVSWNDNDTTGAVAMAQFLINQGMNSSSVVVMDGDVYSQVMGDAFVTAFAGLGGTHQSTVYVNPDGGNADQAIHDVAVDGSPDALYLPVFVQPGAALVSAARQHSALSDTVLAAADGVYSPDFLQAAGPDAEGMFLMVPVYSFMDTPEYAAFAAAYETAYDEVPLAVAAYGYDAASVILAALTQVAVVDGSDTLHAGRQALRDALFATSAFDGLTGTLTCNALGDCGAPDFAPFIVFEGEFVPVPW